MDILFKDHKLKKMVGDQSLLIRKHGTLRAKLIKRRLDDFHALENLEEIRSLPQTRCHELKGNRAGTLAVDLDKQYRLVFEPANDPTPTKTDGGLDWTQVTAIRVLTVEDYHD